MLLKRFSIICILLAIFFLESCENNKTRMTYTTLRLINHTECSYVIKDFSKGQELGKVGKNTTKDFYIALEHYKIYSPTIYIEPLQDCSTEKTQQHDIDLQENQVTTLPIF